MVGWLAWHGEGVARARRHPATWLLLAVLLQLVSSATQAAASGPAWSMLVLRSGALATAIVVAALPGPTALIGWSAALLLVVAALGLPVPDAERWWDFTAPFGNENFAVDGLLPLLPLALLPLGARRSRLPGWVIAGIGLGAVLALGSGLAPQSDAVLAVWLGLGAMGGAALVLAGPRRLAGPLLLGGFALLLLGQVAITAGWLPNPLAAPSAQQRLGLWEASAQAWLAAPLLGHGPGQSAALLPAQSGYWPAWLAVPSFPEHAHHEALQVLLDGGLLLGALLLGAIACSVAPLWARRDEPEARVLLIACVGVAALALVEGHLGQPGPLIALALLAGRCWRCGELGPLPRLATPGRALCAAVAPIIVVALIWQSVLDLRGRGSVNVQAILLYRQLDEFERHDAWLRGAEALAAARAELGPLDDLRFREALFRARAGELHGASELALAQAQHLPVLPGLIDLLERLESAWRRRAAPERAADCAGAAEACRQALRRAVARGWSVAPELRGPIDALGLQR